MIDQIFDEKIRGWIASHQEEILADHMALCRIPSVRGEAEAGAPFGKECARALAFASELFESYGFQTRLEASRGYGLAFHGEGEKTIGIYGHSDVVPVGDGWIKTAPFEPRVIDGVLYGRGVGDNKAGVIASLCALRMVRDLDLPVKSRLSVFIGSNEESGMKDITAFVANETMPEVNLVPDSSFPCSVGEKGILRLWMHSKDTFTDVLDFHGGSASNIVLDEVKVTLKNTPERKAELSRRIQGNASFALAEEGETLILTAFGIAKHAGHPDGSVNAAALASALLAELETLPASDRAILKHCADGIGSYLGEGLGIAHEDEFGPLSAACGMVRTENGMFRINMDIRYGASFPAKELEERLAVAWGEKGYTLHDIFNRPGFRIEKGNPIPDLLRKAYFDLTGVDREPPLLSGGTYSRYLKNSFTLGFRAQDPDSKTPAPELPDGHGGAHQRDEAIILDQFYQAIRVLVHYILICDQEISK